MDFNNVQDMNQVNAPVQPTITNNTTPNNVDYTNQAINNVGMDYNQNMNQVPNMNYNQTPNVSPNPMPNNMNQVPNMNPNVMNQTPNMNAGNSNVDPNFSSGLNPNMQENYGVGQQMDPLMYNEKNEPQADLNENSNANMRFIIVLAVLVFAFIIALPYLSSLLDK